MTEPSRHRPPMVCVCGAESRAEWNAKQDGYRQRWIEPGNDRFSLVDALVQSLWWDYNVTVEAIPTDQWSAVVTEHVAYTDGERDESSRERCWQECDRIEDGLIASYEFWRERLGPPSDELGHAP